MSPAYDIHPEFGYLCLAPRVRRELRVALVSLLFGMMIGAAIVASRAGHAIETDGVSGHAQLRSAGSDALGPGVAGPSSEFRIADSAKVDPVEAIEPYPMRMVRVRSSKAASPLAGVPLGRTAPAEAPASAGPAAPENAEASASPAAPPPGQSVAAAAELPVSGTKKRRSAARRQRDNENENARWQGGREPYWGERAYAEDRNWRGAYRNWVN